MNSFCEIKNTNKKYLFKVRSFDDYDIYSNVKNVDLKVFELFPENIFNALLFNKFKLYKYNVYKFNISISPEMLYELNIKSKILGFGFNLIESKKTNHMYVILKILESKNSFKTILQKYYLNIEPLQEINIPIKTFICKRLYIKIFIDETNKCNKCEKILFNNNCVYCTNYSINYNSLILFNEDSEVIIDLDDVQKSLSLYARSKDLGSKIKCSKCESCSICKKYKGKKCKRHEICRHSNKKPKRNQIQNFKILNTIAMNLIKK